MRHWPRAVLAGGMGFAVSCLAACGGGGPGLLSGDQAGRLQSQLGQVSNAVAAQNCGQAATSGLALGTSIQNLPPTINPNVRGNLERGYRTTYQLALKDCRRTTATTTATTSSTSTTTTSVTPSSTTTTTTSTTTTTTPTTTTPTTPTVNPTTPTTPPTNTSPSGGGGLGGGGGGGGGSGGGGGGGQ